MMAIKLSLSESVDNGRTFFVGMSLNNSGMCQIVIFGWDHDNASDNSCLIADIQYLRIHKIYNYSQFVLKILKECLALATLTFTSTLRVEATERVPLIEVAERYIFQLQVYLDTVSPLNQGGYLTVNI